ncbi:hypothetical protein E4U53_001139 [Claviceps sorghi]|nr:hypothetical protein E4U53_001139 [Claviceps sorghi]
MTAGVAAVLGGKYEGRGRDDDHAVLCWTGLPTSRPRPLPRRRVSRPAEHGIRGGHLCVTIPWARRTHAQYVEVGLPEQEAVRRVLETRFLAGLAKQTIMRMTGQGGGVLERLWRGDRGEALES